MARSKIGIHVGLIGAAICFVALFGGFTPTLLLAGYVLLAEDNAWLRHTAIKAVALLCGIAFLTTILQLIPDCLGCIASLVSIFDGNFDYEKIRTIIKMLTQILAIIKTVMFLALGTKALNQGTVAIPFLDRLISEANNK